MKHTSNLATNIFIDTKEFHYFLGYFLADGHLSKRKYQMSIVSKDKDSIINLQQIIGHTGKIYPHNKVNYTIWISSKELYEYLQILGIDNNKSFTLKWTKNISKQYLSHFVRGFFDGDGSVHYHKAHNPQYRTMGLSFVATPDFIQGLQQNINNTLSLMAKGSIFHHPYKYQEGFYSELIYHGIESVKQILDWIYQDSTENIRMERKYKIYRDYFYNTNEYDEYRKHADDFQQNKVYIPYELVDEIREDYSNGLSQQDISDKHQVNRTVLKNIVDKKTHIRKDNRRSDANRDFLLDGILQHEKDIAKNANMDISTLRHRTRKMGMNIEEAAELTVDRGKNNPRTHLLTVFGEEKSLREWSKDSRCKVPYPTLYHRLFSMGMDIEEAMTTTNKATTNTPNIPPSRASLTQEQANEIRKIKEEQNLTNTQIAESFGVTSYVINDIISGKTYNSNGSYNRVSKTQLKFEYQGKQLTLKELSELSSVPYSTIDRRIREGKTVEEAITNIRMKGTKSLSDKDILSGQMAAKVRSAYMCGKRETEICEMFSIPKSRYADIVLNRTNKEENIWWE